MNTLKLVLKQYNGDNDKAICKLTIKYKGKTYICRIELYPKTNSYHITNDTGLINYLDYHIIDKIKVIADKGIYQALNNRPYGVETYWKWEI